MEQPKKIGSLVETLLTTNFEQESEPYLLSKEEEEYVIANELLRLKQHMSWKMKGLAFSDIQIEMRIKEIDWTSQIDQENILNRANSNKNYEIWQAQQREKEKQDERKKEKDLKELWDAKNVYRLMKWTSEKVYGRPLIVNQYNRTLISAICFFVSGDERFETELKLDFRKGLLIRGISGLGKTHLLKCVAENDLNPIKIISMIEVADEIKQEGEYQINMGRNRIIYLDDVGTEEATVNHYGTKINFFKNFIETVYLRNIEKGFGKLIISTNNSYSEIEEKYGFRVRSRMRDMFNVIEVKGEDMRG